MKITLNAHTSDEHVVVDVELSHGDDPDQAAEKAYAFATRWRVLNSPPLPPVACIESIADQVYRSPLGVDVIAYWALGPGDLDRIDEALLSLGPDGLGKIDRAYNGRVEVRAGEVDRGNAIRLNYTTDGHVVTRFSQPRSGRTEARENA